jgi:guanine deaminase
VSEALKAIDPASQLQLGPEEFCCPGMIDTHVHAPQYQFTGTATDLPLMEWLQTYTFPAERRCADVELATRICARMPGP